MPGYEYKVIPAPNKGVRAKGIRGTEMRFAHALQETMNDLAADGWEYVRAETLPCEERKGLTGRTTVFQNVLVFRKTLQEADTESEPAETAKTPRLLTPKPEELGDDEPAGDVAWRRRLRAERSDAPAEPAAPADNPTADAPARIEPVVSKPD